MKYRAGYKYQLAEDYTVQLKIYPGVPVETEYIKLTCQGVLTVKKGYAWDGASGPTWDSKSSMRASLIHDALYALIRLGFLDIKWRIKVDEEFERICCEDGMLHTRHAAWRKMLNWFGKAAAQPTAERPILEAP